jgi:glycosyltransferase involved in cell wall biosynthesis
MKIRVLSNLMRLASVGHEGGDFEFHAHDSHTVPGVVRAFIGSFRYDYILLNGLLGDALLLALLKLLLPCHRAKIVLLDIMLPTPVGRRGRAKAWVVGRLLTRAHRILVYYHNTSGLQKHYGIPADRFQYVPFKINQREMIERMIPVDGGYIFCGGKTRRDFATLFAAVESLDYPVKVVTMANTDIKRHGSFMDEDSAPPNVEVVILDGRPDEFLSYLAAARLVVQPITPEICGAGISVYIQAMALRKCVIMTAGPAAEDVLTSQQAIIVPAQDPAALRRAIKRAFTDPEYRRHYEERGYEWARRLGGEETLDQSLLSFLRESLDTGTGARRARRYGHAESTRRRVL